MRPKPNQPEEAIIVFNKKQIKTLEKALSRGLDNPKIVEQQPQGNGHITVVVAVGNQRVTVRGVAATPRDWTFTGNKLRQAVRRQLA